MVGLVASTLGVTIISLKSQQRAQRAAAEAQKAAELAATEASAGREDLKNQIGSNGHETLGDGLTAIENIVADTNDKVKDNTEIIAQMRDRLHQGDDRFVRIEDKAVETLAQAGEVRAEVREMAIVLERLRSGFERDDPLRRRAVDEWGADGERGKED
jgi:chromosome segregation ATPase